MGLEASFNVTTASNVICIGNLGGENIDNSCFIDNIRAQLLMRPPPLLCSLMQREKVRHVTYRS